MPGKKTGRAANKDVQSKIEIEQRRTRVASAILQGLTYRQIAIQLHVSPATVTSDRRAIVAEWRKHYSEKANDWIDIECRRLDVMLNVIWEQVLKGSLKHIDTAMKIMERKERLLGIGVGSPAQNPAASVSVSIHIDDMAKEIQKAKDYEAEHYRNAGIPPEPSPN